MSLLAPLLTEFDPAESAEGGIDPLGLYAIADSLALRLIPGIRQRMHRPRFLTAIAVSSVVCSPFLDDFSGMERKIDPSLLFEIYLVEGLVRSCSGEEIQNLPGSLKAARAIKEGVHLSPAKYLKVPSVFGFHGVYRLLTQNLDVTKGGHVGELGYRLLSVWGEEQGLKGFYGEAVGPGAAHKQQLIDAVRDGLEVGAVARTGGWTGWSFFKNHLHPANFGSREAELITTALMNAEHGYRGDVIRFLISPTGREIWESTTSEKQFYKAFLDFASAELRELLETILIYETFARLLTDAFQECLYTISARTGKFSIGELAKGPCTQLAASTIPGIFMEISNRLGLYGETIRFETAFSTLAERMSSEDWVQVLLSHHRRIQKQKPPNGKNPWFETFEDGTVVIRPMYRRENTVDRSEEFVHGYRMFTLHSFSTDLRLIAS